MAETQKLQAALITQFADNATGAISPEDLRDFVVSVFPGWGGFYISSAAATTISGGGTAVKMAGTTTATGALNFTHADNKLTYTGTPTSRFFVIATVSVSVASGADNVSVQIYKDGSLITGAEQRANTSTSAAVANVVVAIDTTLATNSYLEIWLENEDATANITAHQGYMFVLGIMGE